jgi:HrpA-like RNA helicase
MPLLLEQFASKASLQQRRGRAGRVREGVCYKLISRNTYSKLKEHGDPEIRRCVLDQTLLSLIFLGCGSDFMGKLMDPPTKQAVESALFSLRKLGALTAGDSLTPLGMHLAGIPAPPSVGKRKWPIPNRRSSCLC